MDCNLCLKRLKVCTAPKNNLGYHIKAGFKLE
jgi:hypothetical protein